MEMYGRAGITFARVARIRTGEEKPELGLQGGL